VKSLLATIVGVVVVSSIIWDGKGHSEDKPITVIEGKVKTVDDVPDDLRLFRMMPRDGVHVEAIGGKLKLYRESTKLRRLLEQLSETTDEKKKAELTKELTAEIEKSFDTDMKAREEEFSDLEQRVKKLRALLDRRSKAKSDIVALEVKVLVNEAEGLGFSEPSPRIMRGAKDKGRGREGASRRPRAGAQAEFSTRVGFDR